MKSINADDKEDDAKNFGYESRHNIIRNFLLFAHLSPEDIDELAQLMLAVHYPAGTDIVIEGDFVDSIFLIIQGHAEVKKSNNSSEQAVIATLIEGESIGLSNTGFFSSNGKRTATVTALSDMFLLKLDIISFNTFLIKHPYFDKELVELTELMLKLDFIKKLYPFTHLSKDEIHSIALEIKEKYLPANHNIFQQGDTAECCYLLRSGKVEIFLKNEQGTEDRLALLDPPELFGEAAFLTNDNRSTSARTMTECHLLVLEYSRIRSIVKVSKTFSHSLMGFIVNRFRPERNKNVVVHRRITKNNQEMVILHNPELDKYYHVTEQHWFIWQQLDGVQTIRDITMAYFDKYRTFVPAAICELLYGLAEMGFVSIPTFDTAAITPKEPQSFWRKLSNTLRKISEIEFVFTQTDPWFTKVYQRGIWLLYSWPIQILLSFFLVSGFVFFVYSYAQIREIAQKTQPHFWLFLVILIIASIPALMFHEAGHAFTAKKFGYKVQSIGFGWLGLNPVAFTDTSQVWLAKQLYVRLTVDAAGIYVDLLLGGILALAAIMLMDSAAAVYFWLVSLCIYFNAFKNLSMIKEYDGYFMMMNLFDYPSLRAASLSWLVNKLPQIYKHPRLMKNYKPEIYYWFASIVYIAIGTFLTFLILQVLFTLFSMNFIFGIPAFFFSLIIASLTFVFFILNIWLGARHYMQAKS